MEFYKRGFVFGYVEVIDEFRVVLGNYMAVVWLMISGWGSGDSKCRLF